jgi:hypothetical protein
LLPDQADGWTPPTGASGALLVTDTVDPHAPFFYRAAVTVLNPHGTEPAGAGKDQWARGVRDGESFDPVNSYPAYDGIEIEVTDTVPGPGAAGDALAVAVTRGPGDFLNLRIRAWEAPAAYGTHDIWIDWPGNGEEDYNGSDPPLGNGDATHCHPDGDVINEIHVRVHNDGTIDAEDVVVRMEVNEPMGMGDQGDFVALPDSAPLDVPAGGSTDFVFEWRPEVCAHTCLRASILTHETAFGETVVSDNSAQENISEFSAASASPYAPYLFEVEVANPYFDTIEVELLPTGLSAGMELDLEAAYFVLRPREIRLITGRLRIDEALIPAVPTAKRRCAYGFNLHAFLRTEDFVLPFGGITADVVPAKASSLVLRSVTRQSDLPGGCRVTGRLAGPFASGQRVDAALVDLDGIAHGGTALTAASGNFTIEVSAVPPGPGTVMLYYFGDDMASSQLGPVSIVVP